MSMERGEAASTSGSSHGSLDWAAILEAAATTGLPRQEKAPKGLPRQEKVVVGARRQMHVGAPPCAFVHHRRTGADSGLRQMRDGAASWGLIHPFWITILYHNLLLFIDIFHI
jgi:hypothetical protein